VEEEHFEKELQVLNEAEYLKAKKVVEFLIKTLKNIMIYPDDNPIPQEHKRRFFQKLTEFLDDYQELQLEIRPAQFYYKGEMIYQDQSEKDGLAYSMYRDGINEMTFKKDLTLEELSDLMEIFRVGVGTTSLEDDLVTMLWENDFDHISYKVIEEFLGEDAGTSFLDNAFSDFEKLEENFSVYYAEINLPEDKRSEVEQKEKIRVQNTLRNVKSFVKDEVIKIDQLLKKDESYDGIKEVLSVVEEIIFKEKELPEFNETVKVMEKTMDRLLENGDFEPSYKVIQLLEDLEQTYKEKSPQRSSRLSDAINRAGDSERIKLMISVLNKKGNLDLEGAKAYLTSLNWNSIFNILNMLGELDTYPARKMVCDVLADFGKEHFEMVARGISDHRWYVVRNVVWILGKIGSPKAIPYMKDTIKHDELQVRREAIRALELIGGPEAAQILLLALDDPSPRIRIRAVSLLGKTKEITVLEPLLQIIKDKGFKYKSEEEKKAYLFSLAEIGGDQVVLDLKRIIKKGNWLFREKDPESKILAIKALGSINTSDAKNALEELSRKGKKQLRETSQKILDRLNRHLEKEV
jgi:HEAT repeat protein